MSSLIQRLAKQTCHTFLPLARGAEPHQLEQLVRLVGTVTAKDLNFDPKWVSNTEKYQPSLGNAPVTYVHIEENEIYSMGIFILRNGYSLPLHDHPAMYGICKVIHGKVGITAYSHTHETRPIPRSLQEQRFSEVRPTVAEKTLVLDQDSCCCLSPTRRNLHQIQAVDGPAAFLDILAPPYDHYRNCHYYKEVLEEDGISWLMVVPQPTDYWCHQAQYTGPSVEL